jgi:Arc/MetJ family transcription regulator
MRTTLELDDELMNVLLARHPGASKREAVERAIRSYLEEDAATRVIGLLGQIDGIEDVSAELRKIDRHT